MFQTIKNFFINLFKAPPSADDNMIPPTLEDMSDLAPYKIEPPMANDAPAVKAVAAMTATKKTKAPAKPKAPAKTKTIKSRVTKPKN